jgi:ATP-binding cassette subfamily B protein
VLILASAALGYLFDHLGMRWHWRHKEEESGYYQRMDYITARTRDKAFAKDIRIYRMQDWLTGQLRQAEQGLESYARRRTAHRFAGSTVAPLLGLLRTLAVSAVLLERVLNGQLTAAGFLLTFSAAAALADRVTDILACASRLAGDCFQISQVREFAEWPEPFLFETGAKIPIPADGKYTLELRDVSYRYPGAEKDILSHIDLTVAPGEKLAVEGNTVTGQAAGASFEFGLKLIETLRGADTARRVREEIYL